MIVDKIENLNLYLNLEDGVVKALNYIAKKKFSTMEVGKYELDGDKLFAIVNDYKTKSIEGAESEVHEQYIDVQFIVSGEESIGYAPLNNQKPTVEYNADSDVAFYNEKVSLVNMKTGMFAIFYPTDIHMPGIVTDKSVDVRKVVVKIRCS